MEAAVRAIEYHLPEQILSNERLAEECGWPVEKIEAKTGIRERRIAAPEECASDLAVQAARRLFQTGIAPADVDYVLFCTQSPDYPLPTTACLLQHRLGIPISAGALDFNLGCSGYIYGLSLAKGLIESGQVRNVLLLTADTYSKYLDPQDRGVRTLFGDGASATWIVGEELPPSPSGRGAGGEGEFSSNWARRPSPPAPLPGGEGRLGPVIFGTDGAGAENLIVRKGGTRRGAMTGDRDSHLCMNGGEIFTFTLRMVPKAVQQLLERSGLTLSDVDCFVFHQANQYMLDHLRQKIGIPPEKFIVELRDCGNTVSSTIPIALKRAVAAGRIRAGHRVMLVGFGVGYSWGALMLRWQ
jgi:3-oxoacyl-[acyl-carrier-protein] synthase III